MLLKLDCIERWNTPNVEIDRISIAIYSLDGHKLGISRIFYELFLTVVLMSTFNNKNSLRTIWGWNFLKN